MKGANKKLKDKNDGKVVWTFLDGEPDSDISNLVESLGTVDTDNPNAELNATSINDNNGGRIELGEDSEGITKK